LAASQSLSQLSYGPLVVSKCSHEVEIICPIHAALLVVPRLRDAQKKCGVPRCELDWDQKAAVEVGAIRSDRVYLVRRVRGHPIAVPRATKRAAPHDYCSTLQRGPLALQTQKPILQSEDKVAPTTLRHRPVNLNSKLDRRKDDRLFRDRAFLIRCHASQRSGRIGWAVSVLDNRDSGYTPAQGKELTEP
jgi:hypothetical protein